MDKEGEHPTGEMTSTDEPSDTVHAHYDWSTTSPVEAVIDLVADATNKDPPMLDPLYYHVDPDALTTLLTTTNGDQAPAIQIEIAYADYEVTLRRNGDVSLQLD